MTEQVASHADQVRQFFDAKAPAWSAKYSPDGRLAGRVTRFTAALDGHVRAVVHVLDLGCGTGELAMTAAAAGMRVTACDISAEMLRRAADSDLCGAVRWVQLESAWCGLPFGHTEFDAVVAASVLEYVDDPSVVLAECARVLRPGGVMVCTVPDPMNPVRWLEWLVKMTAGLTRVRQASCRVPRLADYLGYLQVSRQRHTGRWWSHAAKDAGLLVIAVPGNLGRHAPLRLLTFRRPGHTREGS
jgi:2-polyprenyl-3-methyl-5-hydroxy-6-metoxy-1,4-benzoquinol methylase